MAGRNRGKPPSGAKVVHVVAPTDDAMTDEQKITTGLVSGRAGKAPGYPPSAQMDLDDYLIYRQRGGSRWTILQAFGQHIANVTGSRTDQMSRHAWDTVFDQFANSDNSAMRPLPSAADVKRAAKLKPPTQ